MHTLAFLDPGHFHAALTLRARHARVAPDVFVYAPDGPERRDFLTLVERFNTRATEPTCWRLNVIDTADAVGRLVGERRADVVVLAGKNGGKARLIARLHQAGFHVLADKPWLVEPADVEFVRQALSGWPLAMELLTGRHDAAAGLLKRLVDVPGVFGEFRAEPPAIELDSVHHLEKLVDGAPLRRPWWFFDVRVQGNGAVDIPTHLVDQTQWLVEDSAGAPGGPLELLSARAWATRVPVEAFCRITAEPGVPAELASIRRGDALDYLANAELGYRIGNVVARTSARWELRAPAGGGDTYRAVVHGTRADLVLEQGPRTGGRRRLTAEPRGDRDGVERALAEAVRSWQSDLPGVRAEASVHGALALHIPAGLDGGHETHFTRVLDAFLDAIDDARWPAALAERTRAKYALLSEAAAATSKAR